MEQRNSTREEGYKNSEEIREDIVDLAGIRIGLYIPNDLTKVDPIIDHCFHVREPIAHNEGKRVSGRGSGNDYVERFSGYRAKHHRVFLRRDENLKAPKDIVEIQVISMLAHTWAQVGHDLIYKPMDGSASLEERRILDGLSGLIQTGELILEHLHTWPVWRLWTNFSQIATS